MRAVAFCWIRFAICIICDEACVVSEVLSVMVKEVRCRNRGCIVRCRVVWCQRGSLIDTVLEVGR